MSEPTPSAELLLQQTGWLKALALRLVRDDGRADDVVQQTLVKALERPPRDPRALSAWLARVARNEAKQIARSEGARVRREQRAARPDVGVDPSGVVERAEIHREVVDAVLAVAEPFRTILLLRYFDGLEPTEIARHLGLPAGTVRSRLKRGLDQARRQLDAREGDRRQWALALVPILDPRDLKTWGAAGTTTAAAGALLMTTKAKVLLGAAVLLLVAAAVGIVGFGPHGDDTGRPHDRDLARNATPEAPRADPRLEGQEEGASSEPVVEPVAPAPAAAATGAALSFVDEAGRTLEPGAVETRYREAGMSLEAMFIRDDLLQPTDPLGAAMRRFTGSDEGRAVTKLDVSDEGLAAAVEAGRWRLFIPRPGATPWISESFSVAETGVLAALVIPLPSQAPKLAVKLVAAESGEPLGGAKVTPYYEFGDDLAFFAGPALVADADGVVRIPDQTEKLEMPRSRMPAWWAHAPGRLAPVPLYGIEPGASAPATRPVPRTADVSGLAYRQDGRPAAGCLVVWTKKGWAVRATVAEDGSFRLAGIPTNRSSQPLFLVEDVATATIGRQTAEALVPGGEVEVTIGESASTSPRATLFGRITAGKEPLTDAIVVVRSVNAKDDDGGMARVDANGDWRIVVPAGSVTVGVYFGGVDDFYLRPKSAIDLATGEEKQLDLDLPGGAVLVTLLDAETGEPVRGGGAYVTAEDREAGRDRFEGYDLRAGAAGVCDAEGKVLLRGLLPGEPQRMNARARGYAKHEQTGLLPSREGEDPVEVTVRLKRE